MSIQVVGIEEVCSEMFAGGDAPKGHMSSSRTEEYSIPIYSNGEDNDGLYGYTDKPRVIKPSITISARGTIGYTVIRKEPYVPVVRLISITPISEKVTLEYLSYALQNYHFVGSGTSIPQLTIPMLKEYKFPLPDLPTQRRIAATLDKVSEGIALCKQMLADLDELVKSQFVEMFGDPTINSHSLPQKTLPELGENLDSRRIPITSSDRKAGQYPYYGASGIVDYVDGFIFDEDILLISEDGANLLARVTPIAFPASGKVWVNNHAHVIRFDSMAKQVYIEYLLNMIDISNYVTGTAQPKLNQAKMNTIPIPVPEEAQMERFRELTEQSDKSKLAVQQQLAELETLKKSLMQIYFG